MSFSISPGVTTTEIDLTTGIEAQDTRTAGIAASFTWGPLNTPRLITSQENLVSNFGKPDANTYANWFSAANFLDYSNSLYVVRVGDTENTVNAYKITNATAGIAESLGAAAKLESANVSAVQSEGSNTITVTGVNTYFDTDLVVNDVVILYGKVEPSGTETRFPCLVKTISSNVSIELTSISSNSAMIINADAGEGAIYRYGALFANDEDFEADENKSDYGQFAAKYPGGLGNSLRVSICSSANLYETQMEAINCTSDGKIGYDTSNAELSFMLDNINGHESTVVFVFNGDEFNITGIDTDNNYIETNWTIGTDIADFETTWGFKPKASIRWKYAKYFENPPGTSDFAANYDSSNDEIHIAVIDEYGLITGRRREVLEIYEGLSKASDAKAYDGTDLYYVTHINQKSNYIRVLDHPTTDASGAAITNWGEKAYDGRIYGCDTRNIYLDMYNGRDGQNINYLQNRITGYDLFADDTNYNISFIISGESSNTLNQYIIDNVVEKTQKACVFISPLMDDVVNVSRDSVRLESVLATRNAINRSTSYGFMTCNWKYQYDKYNDVYRWVPDNGDIAGLWARSDVDFNPWWSAAGVTRGKIKNVVRLAWNPNEAQRDQLYLNGINPVVSFKNTGPVLWGDKTMLSKNSVFSRANVRRLFIVLRTAIAEYAKNLLFEFNDEFTRYQFKNIVEPYLKNVQALRGIEDFTVICDETNNTPEVRNNNQFVGDIYIIPNKSINFIKLNFVAVRSGVSFEEVVGRIGV